MLRDVRTSATSPRTTSSTGTSRWPALHPLRRAARLPASTAPAAVDRIVDETLAALDLAERDRARRFAVERAAQAGEHRRGDAHPSGGVLPRRTDLRPGPGDRRGAAAPAPAGGCRHDDRPDYAQPDRHRPCAADCVPRSRRLPGLRGDARRGSSNAATGDLTVAYSALALEDTPRHGRSGSRRSGGAASHDARRVTGPPTPAPVQSAPNPSGEPDPLAREASGTAPPVGRPDPAQRRPPGPQPADAGGARRVAGARDRRDGRAVPPGAFRRRGFHPRPPRRPRRCSGWPSPSSSSV